MIKLTNLEVQKILLKNGVPFENAVKIIEEMTLKTYSTIERLPEVDKIELISCQNISNSVKLALERVDIQTVTQLKKYVEKNGLEALLKIKGIGISKMTEIKEYFKF